ncbi:hypothetical protein [Nocardioides sp. ChNu-99]|uniref:hypothetical protein n=1 Tax=Nocardioides sp. ChNu-99 TaxID=2839897 RepID=UPI0024058992|nr:hypothetical protein [Nocardioides sp. ChNu-99]MDF9717630.1 hypothetical protein [Nocardioides sp. ChNu-99]
MTAPAPDLPAVTLTDEERGLIAGTIDSCTVWETVEAVEETVERIVAARLAAQPVAPAPDRDALLRVLNEHRYVSTSLNFEGIDGWGIQCSCGHQESWDFVALDASDWHTEHRVDAILAARPAPDTLAADLREFLDARGHAEGCPLPLGWDNCTCGHDALRALLADQPAATPEGGASDG